jgi:hypothetical protein
LAMLLTGECCGLTASTLIRGAGAVLSAGFTDIGPPGDAGAGWSGMGREGCTFAGSELALAAAGCTDWSVARMCQHLRCFAASR